jgi:peroxiredoxin
MTNNALQPGSDAPEFALAATPDQKVGLSELLGSASALVIAFYPADWSPVCTDQMALYNEILPEFRELGATLVGISVDSAWCHNAFAAQRNLHFPLLADFHPKGEVAQQYGVYDESTGVSERALFVIDADGVIRWSYVSPIGVNPGADGILRALEEMAPATAGTPAPVSS